MAESQVNTSGGYRVKFMKEQFLDLVRVAQPRIIYRARDMYFFSFEGFAMYTADCTQKDFAGHKILDAIEFSNMPWRKAGQVSQRSL